MQRMLDVNVRFERKRGVEHRLDALLAVLGQRFLDAMRARGGLLENPAAGHRHRAHEQRVAAREIGVTEHVRQDQHVLRKRVAVDEVGMARIAGKHYLEDPRVAHAALNQVMDVAHAERPVRHAHRQAVHGGLHHEVLGNELEVDGVVLEALRLRQRLDLRRVFGKRCHEFRPVRSGRTAGRSGSPGAGSAGRA